jgi:hypothetical protein
MFHSFTWHYKNVYPFLINSMLNPHSNNLRGRRGGDRMVVWIYKYLCNQWLSPLK